MAGPMKQSAVYLEIGSKRVFAVALDWPGWCRSGRDAGAAMRSLVEYGPRYERVLREAEIEFSPPGDPLALDIVERLEGNTTTDFGAPDVVPSSDSEPLGDAELRRLEALLKACWAAFDAAAALAEGKELRKGPRGGGRDLEGVISHVQGAEAGYLSRLGGKSGVKAGEGDPRAALERTRQAVLETLQPSARGEIPAQGPRGGARWSPRFFVRRAAWHVLDHAWELEDRV